MGKWAKRLRGERESGRNDPGAKRLGAKGKVGETTQGRTGKWAKRPGFVHLANDAVHIGGLDNISSFPFENFLQKLKLLFRKPSFPLEQVIRRLSEQTDAAVGETFPVLKKEHHCSPLHTSLPAGACIQFRSVQTEKFRLKLNSKDCCVRISDTVGLVQNIVSYESEILIVYVQFRRISNGPRQANLVLIAYASSEGSGEPAHSRSLDRTFAARSYKQ